MAAVVKTIHFEGSAVALIEEDFDVQSAKVAELQAAIVSIPGFQSVDVDITSVKKAGEEASKASK